jgi:hypothetical protein
MGLKFNPLTSTFDLVGSGGGGASYIDGEVATYADLPLDGSATLNSAWLVRTASGVWPVTRKQAGIYIRTATGGSNRDSDYTYAGTMPDVFSDSQFLLYDNSDSSRNLAFDLGSISTGTTRTLTAPNANGRIALSNYAVVTSAQTLAAGSVVAADTTAGAFTLTLPATPANGDTVSILDYAGTFDTNNLIIARNGSNIEGLAEDLDCNIEDAAFSLVYVGSTVGWKVVPYFGSKTSLASAGPIGSTIPSTGAFTTLTASALSAPTVTGSSQIIGPQGANVGSVTAPALSIGAANTGIYISGNQLIFTQAGADRAYFDNSARFFVSGAGGISIGATNAPLTFTRAISLNPDANGELHQRSTTQSQSYFLYNTFTSTTNHERGFLKWASNVFQIGTEKGSSGTARGLELRTDNVARITISDTGGIGFYGVAAAARPAAVADATDAASVITQLNTLLSRLRTIGLLST